MAITTNDVAINAACDSILAAARLVTETGAVARSGHGNISALIPGTNRLVITAVGGVTKLTRDDLALITIDGEVLDGEIQPTNAEIIHMHTGVYQRRPDVGGVIHTHAIFLTAYAIANQPLDCFYEGMVRNGQDEPVPVAAYAPRGSDESVSNIVSVISDRTKGVLLQNHGVLTFAGDPVAATRSLVAMEEAAEAGIYASALGTPTTINAHMAAYAQRRAAEFAAQGAISR